MTTLAEEIPPQRGLTAEEAAEILHPRGGWRKLDTLRRRAHEAAELGLLDYIGQRLGAETGKPNQIYEINDFGLAAWRTLERGEAWPIPLHPLARYSDPETSKEGAKMKRPNTDFHRVLTLYVRHGR
jgi:hypothetical protein